jgi:H+/Cl- antiporter ClcA
VDTRFHWMLSALIFGLVLGLLYFVGGQTVQFSGSAGLKLVLQNLATYSGLAFLGLVVAKMLVTAWSLSSGYRGGLVFPSIYTGVVLSLAISTAFHLTGHDESGTIIGATSGLLVAMTNPIAGIILSFSLFPLSLLPVLTAGAIGAVVGNRVFARLKPKGED